MGKKALCVARDAVTIDFASMALQPIPIKLLDEMGPPVASRLVDRDLCETDETLLQVIPYIVVRNRAGGVFCYERGGGGGEARLHAKLSVGLGGHVDRAPAEGERLVDVLRAEAERELLEELGVTADVSRFTGMLYTGATGLPVDQVHLGLLGSVELADGVELTLEAGNIENGRFLTIAELLETATFERLEPWSQAVVRRMSEQLSERVGDLMSELGDLFFSFSIESPTGATSVATQETASIIAALGRNVACSRATARIYDIEEATASLARIKDLASQIQRGLGAYPPQAA